MFNQNSKEIAKEILLANGYFVSLLDGELVTESVFNKQQEKVDFLDIWKKEFGTSGTLTFTPAKNADEMGYLQSENFEVQFENIIIKDYKGFVYSVPEVKGKGKLIKNKEITVEVDLVPHTWDESLGDLFLVKKLVSINGKPIKY